MKLKILLVRLRCVIFRFRDCPKRLLPIIWSRGWYQHSDWSGSSNYFYPAYPTRYRVSSLDNLIGKCGIIWVRLGSDPAKPELDNGAAGDVVVFGNSIVERLSGPTVLVTTDGDRSVPSGIPGETANAILENPNIVAWYTQNLDGPNLHWKFRFLPIGIDLHTRVGGRLSGPHKKAQLFRSAICKSADSDNRKLRIWSDVHLEQDLGNMEKEFPNELGKPGATLFQTRSELRNGIESGMLDSVLDVAHCRLPLTQIWDKYGAYTFVMSLPGHGIDCHRTWEALALGAIVITVHSPIDELLQPYKVVFLDRHDSEWWKEMTRKDWLPQAKNIGSQGKLLDLDWQSWIAPIKRELAQSYR